MQPPPSAGGMAVAQLSLLGHYAALWPGKDFQIGSDPLGSEGSPLGASGEAVGICPAQMCQEGRQCQRNAPPVSIAWA